MSRIFWNALKVSPALLGASFFVASSTYAAQSVPQPTDAIATNQVVTPAESVVEPDAQLSESPIADTSASELAQQTPSTLNLTLPQSAQVAQVPVEEGTTPSSTILEQINQYNSEGFVESQGQVTNVSQLRDVSPGDWAYEALRSLVERYGCIAGYPDGTYRGNRAMSRYEFAAGLNACLNQIERLIDGGGGGVSITDLETLQRLVQEFQAELTTLGTRVDNLEGRVAFLEDNQFSTTTKLNGEVIFALADIFGGNAANGVDYDENTVLFNRVRLNLDTSFTGRDRLRTRLQAGNFVEFDAFSSGGALNVTREGRFGFTAGGNNDVTLDKLWYRFPVSNAATAHIFANAGNFDDFVPMLNPALESSGTGSISRFGRYNPVYRMGGQNAGAGLTIGPRSPIRVDLGYLAGDAENPGDDTGLFNGSYSALAQLTFQPNRAFAVAATYVNAYNNRGNARNLGHGTGSIASNLGVNRPIVSNSYGLEASFAFSPQLILSGWAGLTEATVIGRGKADVWNYAATLALKDFGSEGSVLGLVFGMEPKLTGSDRTVANLISGSGGRRRDPDTGFHIEGFYKFQLTENVSITPGVIWLTSPGHNNANDDIFVGTVRTTFTF